MIGAPRPFPSHSPFGTIDLMAPFARPINFRLMADRLARIIRFNGEAGAIPVAQHSVMGADALAAETGDRLLAAIFLLHDGHEYVLGDICRPVDDILRHIAGPSYYAALSVLKINWDRAIHKAAGLIDPLAMTNAQSEAIKAMDERMMAAEMLALYGVGAVKDLPPAARRTPAFGPDGLKPWPAGRASEQFLNRLNKFTGKTFR